MVATLRESTLTILTKLVRHVEEVATIKTIAWVAMSTKSHRTRRIVELVHRAIDITENESLATIPKLHHQQTTLSTTDFRIHFSFPKIGAFPLPSQTHGFARVWQ
jgi:hypothetical protein